MKIEDCMADFQIPKHLHYMDSAATSLIPESVIASMNEYDRQYRANVGRGMHRLTRVATQQYQDAHDSISSFIGGKEGTTVFTRNTTEAINIGCSRTGMAARRQDRYNNCRAPLKPASLASTASKGR